jgi:two-component system sensor histidine kinase PilS (NtrC family)
VSPSPTAVSNAIHTPQPTPLPGPLQRDGVGAELSSAGFRLRTEKVRKERINSNLLRLIGARVLVIVSVVITTLLYNPAESAGNPLIVPLVVAGSVQCLLYLALLHFLRTYPLVQAYIQLFGDVLLIMAMMGMADAESFSVLYIAVIAVAALLVGRTGALLIACCAYVAYVPLALDWVVWAQPWPGLPNEPVKLLELLYKLISHLVGFYGVAIMSSYMVRATEQAQRSLAKTHLDLSYLQGLYGDVIQSMTSGLAITDRAGTLVALNPSGEQILGRSLEELQGRPLYETGIFSAEEWQNLLSQTGETPVRAETKTRHPDGRMVDLGYSLNQLFDGEGNWHGYILIFQDLTEWHDLQEQVRFQDRMAALGQMAAGLAHEVGNPLMSISGSVELLSRSLECNPQQDRLFGILLRESRRLNRTVKNFLDFARPVDRQLTEFDISGVLAEDVELLRNSKEVLESHEVVADLDPPEALLRADRDQMDQLFWNLTRNALQAMPDGGRLTVRGRLEEDAYRIEVEDTGIGMGEEEKTRLFQPFKSFFDDGVGLGMAIVYRIVEEHSGRISVESAPGKGTHVIVRLPLEPPDWAEAAA